MTVEELRARWRARERAGKIGRPPRPDIYALCREQAWQEGQDLEPLLWGVMKGLMLAASRGNAKCATLVLRYLGAPLPPDHATPVVNVMTTGSVEIGAGPPVPSPRELGDNLAALVKLVEEDGGIVIDDRVDERHPTDVVGQVMLGTLDELLE